LEVDGTSWFDSSLRASSTLLVTDSAIFYNPVTIGDADADTLAIRAGVWNLTSTATTTVAMTNGLNFDSNTFVIDPNSNNVGIGTASPGQKLTLGTGSNFATEMTAPGSATIAEGTGSLDAGTYYFKIVASDAVGTTIASSETSTTTTFSGLDLSWTASQGAESYRIYFDTTSGGEDEYFTSNTNSYTFATTVGATAWRHSRNSANCYRRVC
jgi:hypothetical protein